MRIATWNVERLRSNSSSRGRRVVARLQEVDADIWILTETHDAIALGEGFQAISTPTVADPPILHHAGEHKTAIWSRWPVVEVLETATPHRAICAVIDTPMGELIVYGTVIPYHAARWPYGTPRNWDAHYAAIATQGSDWQRLRREYPYNGLCLAGDFNQNRTGRFWYGTKWGRALLDLALEKSDLVGVTQVDFPTALDLSAEERELQARSIDQICLDDRWASWVTGVGIWPGLTAEGERLSDHSGVFVDLEPNN